MPLQPWLTAVASDARCRFRPGRRATAAKCCALLAAAPQQLASWDHVSLARAVYALARMQLVRPSGLLTAIEAASFDRLHLFAPSTLSGLIVGLADLGHVPPRPWLHRFCLECYARLSAFNAQELAATADALQRLRHAPSAVWLAAALRAFRGGLGRSPTPSALVKFLVAAVRLGARPDFNWMCAYLAAARRCIDGMRPRELSAVLWACARWAACLFCCAAFLSARGRQDGTRHMQLLLPIAHHLHRQATAHHGMSP